MKFNVLLNTGGECMGMYNVQHEYVYVYRVYEYVL